MYHHCILLGVPDLRRGWCTAAVLGRQSARREEELPPPPYLGFSIDLCLEVAYTTDIGKNALYQLPRPSLRNSP
jgi:hypothetical protein